jgi:hypothetical protein
MGFFALQHDSRGVLSSFVEIARCKAVTSRITPIPAPIESVVPAAAMHYPFD